MKWADTFQPHHVQTLREHTGATKQPFHRHQCTEFFILRCTILSTNSFLSFPLVKSLFTDWQNDLWKHVSKLWIFILNYFRFELVSFHLFLLERHKWLFSNMLRHIGSLSSLAEEITVFFFLENIISPAYLSNACRHHASTLKFPHLKSCPAESLPLVGMREMFEKLFLYSVMTTCSLLLIFSIFSTV